MKKLQHFDQNHGLSAWQKGQFCLLFKSFFILSRKACFVTRTSANTSSLHKTNCYQNFQFFDQIHGLTPLEKCRFCGFLKSMFSLLRKAFLLYKRSKIVFWRFIFAFYDMGIKGVTRGYWGLQGVTGGYKGLQGVTGGYKGLQRGYKGLQGVTRGY